MRLWFLLRFVRPAFAWATRLYLGCVTLVSSSFRSFCFVGLHDFDFFLVSFVLLLSGLRDSLAFLVIFVSGVTFVGGRNRMVMGYWCCWRCCYTPGHRRLRVRRVSLLSAWAARLRASPRFVCSASCLGCATLACSSFYLLCFCLVCATLVSSLSLSSFCRLSRGTAVRRVVRDKTTTQSVDWVTDVSSLGLFFFLIFLFSCFVSVYYYYGLRGPKRRPIPTAHGEFQRVWY